MAVDSRPRLRRLRTAIKKVRFLLSFNITKWLIRNTSARRLSFKRPQGLLDCISNADSESTYYHDALSPDRLSWASPPPPPPLTRTISSTWPEIQRTVSRTSEGPDDVNRRAQEFIDNFYRNLRREVSLDLAYAREHTLERTTSFT